MGNKTEIFGSGTHRSVVKFQEENPGTSYVDAVMAVERSIDAFPDDEPTDSFLDTHNQIVAMQQRFPGTRYADALLHIKKGTEPLPRRTGTPMHRASVDGVDYYKFNDSAGDFVGFSEGVAIPSPDWSGLESRLAAIRARTVSG